MEDNTKNKLSMVFFILALFLSPSALIIGWIGWDWQIGLISFMITFSLFFSISMITAALIKYPSWLQVIMPSILATLYVVLPDAFPLPFDDAVVAVCGAFVTFILLIKRSPNVPKSTIIPLMASALYILIGGFIPGPVDEIIVSVIGVGTSILQGIKANRDNNSLDTPL